MSTFALWAVSAAALAAADLPPLPERAERRYRVEIAGEHAGWASLSVTCGERTCQARWTSGLRAPADAGGGTLERRIDLEVTRSGAARAVRTWRRDGRGERAGEAGAGPVPASLAELLLAALPEGAERRCVAIREEESGRSGEACAARDGAWLRGEVLGTPERFRARPGEPPDEVVLPEQRVHFIADPAAELPCRAPRLLGLAVQSGAGSGDRAGRALRFCGRAAEPARPFARPGGPARLPAAFPDGASCREKTARWLALARAAGLDARHAVGVAWDGASFVWHEWAEVRDGTAWIAVDPSFRQAPAQGPRFTVARFADGDAEAEAEAGRQVLACWGTAGIERAQ